MKPRFQKLLLPVVLAGVAGSLLVMNQGWRTSPHEGSVAAPANTRVLNRAQSRASKDDEKQPDAVLARFREDEREQLWDGIAWTGQNPADLASKKMGDTVTLDLGNGLAFEGKVIVKNEENEDGTRVTGVRFSRPSATLHVRVEKDGTLAADLTPEGSLSVYRWTGTVSKPVFTRLPQTEVLCSALAENDTSKGFPVYRGPALANSGATAAAVAAAVPLLNSRPGAKGCIYLDFDGQTVTGTRWNTGGGGTINATAPSYTSDAMTTIWQYVAEDLAPFSINVTTSESAYNAAPKNKRMRILFTPNDSWFAGSAGGVAYLNSFHDGSGDPCWVFTNNVGDHRGAAMCASHEGGHTFGLMHDGYNAEEYYGGNGRWGPIMGAPYGHTVIQFSNGDYPGATNQEDDLAIVAGSSNGVGYMPDDIGNTAAAASTLGKSSSGGVLQSGLITTNTDVDYFVFSTTGGNSQITLRSPASSPNLDISATLYDSLGTAVLTSGPAGNLAAPISQLLAGGSYTLAVQGGADGTFDANGFSKYGSVGPYTITGTVPGLGAGVVTIIEPTVDTVSIREGNGAYLAASAPGLNASATITWRQTAGPSGGTTTFSSANALSTRANFSRAGLYTLQVQVVLNGTSSTDTVRISVEAAGDPRIYQNLGPVISVNSAPIYYASEGDLLGAIAEDGVPTSATPKPRWEVVSGAAVIADPASVGTSVRFTTPGTAKVLLSASDGQVRTFKELAINVAVRKVGIAVTGSSAKMLIPTNGTVDATWRDLAFDDSAWSARKLAIGYNTKTTYKLDLAGGSDIKTVLYNKGTSAYIRVPFDIRDVNYVTSMALNMKFDDGFVMYLNGTEILRNKAPAVPVWNSAATGKRTAAEISAPIQVDLTAHKGLLLNGANVLAIHGLNSKKNDADFLIAPQLNIELCDTPYYRKVVEASPLAPALLHPAADADGDTMSNMLEYALGRDPLVSTPAVMVLTPDGIGAVKVTLPYTAPDDVTYILERSYDLATWTPIAKKVGSSAWTGTGITVTTVGTAYPLATFKIQEEDGTPSAAYQLKVILGGPF